MATYGQGQMLGAGIDPRMFVQDYSGFARAGAIQGEGYANLGQQIGQAAKDYGDQQKERKKLDADTKANSTAIESAIKLGDQLGINLKDVLSPISQKINDPNTTPLEANALSRAAAQQISSAFTLGIQAKQYESELQFNKEKLQIERDKLKAREPVKPSIFEGSGGAVYSVDPVTATAKPITIGGRSGNIPEAIAQYSQSFDQLGRKYGVDPKLLEAISIHETGGGTSSAFRDKNNLMGVSNEQGPIQFQRPEDSIERMAKLIGEGVHQNKGPYAGVKDIESLGRVYAPIGAANDPRGLNKDWTSGVTGIYNALNMGGGKPVELRSKDGKPQQGEVMTGDQLQEEIKRGLEINAVPIGGGKYFVTQIKAGGKPLVEVNNAEKQDVRRETMIDEGLIKTKESAAQAAAQKGQVEEVIKLLDEGVQTGFAQDTIMKGKRILGQDVSSQEQFKAASGRIAMGFVNLTKGAISDREMKYFTEELAPNIGTSVDGNKKIAEFLRGATQKAEKIETTITEGMKSKKSPYDIDQEVQRIRNESNLIQQSTGSDVFDPEIEEIRRKLNLR